MKIGKLSNALLKSLILDKIKHFNQEILIGPSIGEDCCAIDFGESACVLSSDPITGAVQNIGKLAVHIACNDVASCGVAPMGLLMTILAPPTASEQDIEKIMTDVCETAAFLKVDILGGHTEVTDAVNRFVLSSTTVGKVLKDKLISSSGACIKDSIVLTKTAGLEGTAIIAGDRALLLEEQFGKEFVVHAQSFLDQISVVREGVLAGSFGATSMHDVTEGGVLGAVWEMAEASKKGVRLYANCIAIAPETQVICDFYDIDPFKLISSGCMLITTPNGEALVGLLEKNGIHARVIGEVTADDIKQIQSPDGQWQCIEPPASDALYQVLARE